MNNSRNRGWALAGLCGRLADAVGNASPLPGPALAGAAMAGAFGRLTAAVEVAGAIDQSQIGPTTAAAVCAWRTRLLPRWWAVFSALVGVLLVIGPIGWLGLIFGLPVWTLGTSLFVLLQRSRESVRTAAAAI